MLVLALQKGPFFVSCSPLARFPLRMMIKLVVANMQDGPRFGSEPRFRCLVLFGDSGNAVEYFVVLRREDEVVMISRQG